MGCDSQRRARTAGAGNEAAPFGIAGAAATHPLVPSLNTAPSSSAPVVARVVVVSQLQVALVQLRKQAERYLHRHVVGHAAAAAAVAAAAAAACAAAAVAAARRQSLRLQHQQRVDHAYWTEERRGGRLVVSELPRCRRRCGRRAAGGEAAAGGGRRWRALSPSIIPGVWLWLCWCQRTPPSRPRRAEAARSERPAIGLGLRACWSAFRCTYTMLRSSSSDPTCLQAASSLHGRNCATEAPALLESPKPPSRKRIEPSTSPIFHQSGQGRWKSPPWIGERSRCAAGAARSPMSFGGNCMAHAQFIKCDRGA